MERAADQVRERSVLLAEALSPRRIGQLGIVIGALAAWIAFPPLETRTVWWSVVVAVPALVCGGYAIRRGERRIGWGACATGLIGINLGYLATVSGTTHLESVFVWSTLLATTLRYATPLVFAAIGGMFSERSGVVNIALEGMMLAGAFFGILAADKLGSWILGLVVAAVAGGVFAAVHAVFAIHLRADQIVGGTAINVLALGLTGYLFIDIYGDQGTPADISAIPNVTLPGLEHVYFIGPAIGKLNLMIWLAIAAVVISYIVMFRTPIGLRIRAVGEHPRAADTVGIPVYRIRYGAVILSGMLAALGGAYLTVGNVHSFNQNITAGRGFIALAALIFGRWNPFGAFAAALLFGFSSALAQRLQDYSQSAGVLFNALPYVLTLIAVAGVIGRAIPPAAVGRPYKKQ
jgi:ABC-type uncharacterized transport system permease subunit